MTDIVYEDPQKQISYLRQILSSNKKPIGLFLGAGCPVAIRVEGDLPLIPDVAGMTSLICNRLNECDEYKEILNVVEEHFKIDGHPEPTMEDILTHIRTLHMIAGSDRVRGLSAVQIAKLDSQICHLINQQVDKLLPYKNTPYHRVATWMDAISRDYAVEVFTTNYDLLMEQALENQRVPYFDGFSGAHRPLFDARTMEEDSLPPRWVRLWKLHGSVNWYQNDNMEIYRSATTESTIRRVIHPSHLKYHESRRMPYLGMIDRLRGFVKNPTSALVLCGYSFRDSHINETIVQGLQYTQTAVAFALLFDEIEAYEEAAKLAVERANLNVLARNGGIVGGQKVKWLAKNPDSISEHESKWVNWRPLSPDKSVAELELGDFNALGNFLGEYAEHVL